MEPENKVVSHFCDRDWHDGDAVAADYYVTPHKANVDDWPSRQPVGFSACRVHVEAALHVMTGVHGSVRVRRVNE